MRTISQRGGYLLAVVLLLALPVAVRAQSVVTVLTVKVKGDQDAYLAKTKPLRSLLMKNGATNLRVFRALLAGDRTGLLSFVAEYPNMEAYGKAAAKAQAEIGRA